jgi:hypothetical protein
MGEATKKAKKTKGAGGGKAAKVKERQERRFAPRPLAKRSVVMGVGSLSGMALGAGVWAQFGHEWTDNPLPPYPFAPALIAAGAIAFGAAVWLGTSGEAPLRVGSGGIGIERAKEVVRIPWHGVERIVWDPDTQSLSIRGSDDMGSEQQLTVTTKVHPGALAWIVKEARARIPDMVDVPDEAHGLPAAEPTAGELLTMDPVQVVGKRCAESDRIIAYEPDARVCPRCERVYYKAAVPETCACGASLSGLRPEGAKKAKAADGADKGEDKQDSPTDAA